MTKRFRRLSLVIRLRRPSDSTVAMLKDRSIVALEGSTATVRTATIDSRYLTVPILLLTIIYARAQWHRASKKNVARTYS